MHISAFAAIIMSYWMGFMNVEYFCPIARVSTVQKPAIGILSKRSRRDFATTERNALYII